MRCSLLRIVSPLAAFLSLLPGGPALAAPAEETGLRAPAGFAVELYAGDDLAHDIFSMTLDPRGRVVVAGLGYVKILHDDDRDGRADRATLFSSVPASGAHGMCFDGNDLICTGDQSLLRLRDHDGDGVAEGEPVVLARLRHPEHGANGVVQGPDGWFYVICGNDAGVSTEHVSTARSPVREPQCGAVVRVSPDGRHSEVVAHGFRNPYDLAFTAHGSLFTVDADGERDQHLPWYSPTRLFDIATGMHHGWMLQGWQKSWNRPPWFPDNVDRACEIGRGSPTGVEVYRHRQFPERYRGNVLSCCWTLGRVYHFPLRPIGSTFRAEREIFLETTGDVGFAPVDLAVGPEGDLFVAIGGRRTRGSVFRVRYRPGEHQLPPSTSPQATDPQATDPQATDPLTRVLNADQPGSAWSRAEWVPLAKSLGAEPFRLAMLDPGRPAEQRVRAIEILTELFEGVLRSAADAQSLAGPFSAEREPQVVARWAWSLGRGEPTPAARTALQAWTHWQGPDAVATAVVRRAAWEAWLGLPLDRDAAPIQEKGGVPSNSNPLDRRVRFARLRAIARHAESGELSGEPEPAAAPRSVWDDLWQRHLRSALGPDQVGRVTELLPAVADSEELLEAIRLAELALGDIETSDADPRVLPGYALRNVEMLDPSLREALQQQVSALFPRGKREWDLELARLGGMLQLDDPQFAARLMERCTNDSPVTDDLHYLLVLSFLTAPRTPDTTARTADVLLRLAGKMEQQERYPSRNWPLRVAETFERLIQHDPELAAAFWQHERLGHADHSLLVRHLPASSRPEAARRLLQKLRLSDADWTAETVGMAALLPSDEAYPLLRDHWEDFAIRDAIVQVLAESPQPADRERFIESLGSPQPAIVEVAGRALLQLAEPPTDSDWLVAIHALRRYLATPQNESVRAALAALIRHWSDGTAPAEPIASKNPREAYEPYLAWFTSHHPELAAQLSTWSDDLASWRERLSQVTWERGEALRGREIFAKRACQRCHAGSGPLGPDLAGVASRLSRDDLFAHIVDPNREVSPLYQTTQVVTGTGRVVVGLIVYESPESTLVQTGPDTTVRVAGEEIVAMTKSNQSLMPVGLLNDLRPEELADLYAYLQTLRK